VLAAVLAATRTRKTLTMPMAVLLSSEIVAPTVGRHGAGGHRFSVPASQHRLSAPSAASGDHSSFAGVPAIARYESSSPSMVSASHAS
jgi:hypothetical protein